MKAEAEARLVKLLAQVQTWESRAKADSGDGSTEMQRVHARYLTVLVRVREAVSESLKLEKGA